MSECFLHLPTVCATEEVIKTAQSLSGSVEGLLLMRPFELRDLTIFTAVVRAGSFRAAASTLGIEPSAISRRIRLLEDYLGASLFERRRSGATATNAGRRFEVEIRALLQSLDDAVRNIRLAGQAEVGRIDMGVINSLSSRFMGRLLTAFRRDRPDVELSFYEGRHDDLLKRIAHRSLDLAFVLERPRQAEMEFQRLWTEPVYVALASTDLRSSAGLLSLDSLADDKFIVSFDLPGPEVHDFIIRRLSGANLHPRVDRHAVGREGLLSLVGLGFGISLVCGAEERISYPNVTFVPLRDEHVSEWAVWSPANDNPALRLFLSLARSLSREEQQIAAVSRTPDPSP